MPLVQSTTVEAADGSDASVTFPSPVTPGNTIIILGAAEGFGETPATTLATNQDDTIVQYQTGLSAVAVLARIDSAVGGETTVTMGGVFSTRLMAQEWSGLTFDSAAGVGNTPGDGSPSGLTTETPNATTVATAVSFSAFTPFTGENYADQELPAGFTLAGRFHGDTFGQFVAGYRAETTIGVKSAVWPDMDGLADPRGALIFVFSEAGGGGTETDLTSADMVHAQALDAATLSTGVSVSPADLAHGQALDAVVLSTVVGLSPADLAHTQSLDAVALSSSTRLTLADMLHAHALESPTLSTALSLSLADLLHSQALDAVALSSSIGLVPADMAHGHALDAAVLSTVVGLALADLLHSHALDAVALSTDDATSLAVADMLQAHALESPALSSSVGLTVARLVHAQSLDAVTLGATLSLVVADLLHSHALDAVVLDNVPGLTVADLTHAHALESPALSALATLVLADMLHAHRLDGVTLSGDAVDTEKALRVEGRPRIWGIEGTRRNWRIQ